MISVFDILIFGLFGMLQEETTNSWIYQPGAEHSGVKIK